MKSLEIPTIQEKIAQLEGEIATRQAEIESLQEAFATLESGQPRPANPSADSAFELLKELIGQAPRELQERQLYDAKLKAAKQSLRLTVENCEQKQRELQALREQWRQQQQAEAFEQLQLQAGRFNELIDQALLLLDSMRSFSKEAGPGKLQVTADLQEIPYCSVNESLIRIRRRFDVKQG